MSFYKGKLSYTLAVVAIVWAAAGYFLFGLDQVAALEIFWAGATVFGIRRAIS